MKRRRFFNVKESGHPAVDGEGNLLDPDEISAEPDSPDSTADAHAASDGAGGDGAADDGGGDGGDGGGGDGGD